jgi:hypothetical protein
LVLSFFLQCERPTFFNLTYIFILQRKQIHMLISELTLIQSTGRRKGKKRKPTSLLWCLQSPWAKPWELVPALVGLVQVPWYLLPTQWAQEGAWVWVWVVVPVMVVEWE